MSTRSKWQRQSILSGQPIRMAVGTQTGRQGMPHVDPRGTMRGINSPAGGGWRERVLWPLLDDAYEYLNREREDDEVTGYEQMAQAEERGETARLVDES